MTARTVHANFIQFCTSEEIDEHVAGTYRHRQLYYYICEDFY